MFPWTGITGVLILTQVLVLWLMLLSDVGFLLKKNCLRLVFFTLQYFCFSSCGTIKCGTFYELLCHITRHVIK